MMIEEQKPNNSTETAILPMQCSMLRDYVIQLRENVTKLKNREGIDELAQKYYSGQDLICSMVLNEIDKICPPVAYLPIKKHSI
jgi:hypothetical protein